MPPQTFTAVHFAAGAVQKASETESPNGKNTSVHKYSLPAVIYTSANRSWCPASPIFNQPSFANVPGAPSVRLITAVNALRTCPGVKVAGNSSRSATSANA